jgi:hypothetical protein
MQNQNAVSIEPMEDGLSPLELRARAGYYQLLAGAFVRAKGRDYLAVLRAPELRWPNWAWQFDTDVHRHTPGSVSRMFWSANTPPLFTTSGGCPAGGVVAPYRAFPAGTIS